MPQVTVAIPSHDRPDRLRALLDGLETQTIEPERFEVVVCHDSGGGETEQLLRSHPIARAGRLSHVRLPYGQGKPSIQRNHAWRRGRAQLVAFVDDDCRPAPTWLEALLRVAAANPGAIVEGATRPDPAEAHLLAGPYARSLEVDPPSPWAPTCNMLYPRDLLERLSGFDESFPVAAGEDTDLMLRAVAAGAAHVGAPEALVWHAVDPGSLLGRLRSLPRWQHTLLVVRRHPQIRATVPLGIFFKESHLHLVPALAGLFLGATTGKPLWLALTIPWLDHRRRWYGRTSGRAAAYVRDTAGLFVVDVAELAVIVRGAVRYRTFMI